MFDFHSLSAVESEISFTINAVEVTERGADIELVVMSDREFQENQTIQCSSDDGTTQGIYVTRQMPLAVCALCVFV